MRVLSNSDGAYQRVKLAAVGLGDLGDTGFYSGELGVAKPDPRIFRAAAAALRLRPDQIMLCGGPLGRRRGGFRGRRDAAGLAESGRSAQAHRLGQPPAAPVVEIASLAELDIWA